MKNLFLFFFLLAFTITFGQKLEYSALRIPDSLKENANAVIRLDKTDIKIASQKLMVITATKATTVLNELGLQNLYLSENYDRNSKINFIQATAYDAFGIELKKYKRKDFRDTSVADGYSIFNDSRALYLDYTPITYPFTIVFETEVETSNTAFIPSWTPFSNYLVSAESTSFTISFKPELQLRKKEVNFSEDFPIEKKETSVSISYSAKNLTSRKKEELSPDFYDIVPIIYFALDNFQLENVEGNASNWADFGKWYYNSLLADTEEIPEATQLKIRQLVGTERDPMEIARIVYKYVQERTRYVSIQVGIGGWKPMLAKDVDKLGYGDCKALTNFTRCLLKTVGIPSYFTLVYAGEKSTQDLQNDFASVQGNHAILTLPIDKKLVWLECTSQIQPFGFQGNFTDDRSALLIKPEGGEIVTTKMYTEKDNFQFTKGHYRVTESGDFIGNVKIVSNGLIYERNFGKQRMSRETQLKKYKEEFDHINNLKITKITFNDNPKMIEFTEDLEMEAEGYAQNSGGKLMFALNAFDQDSDVPKKYRSRQFPFQIERGYTAEDDIEIAIPEGFVVEAKPNTVEQETEFGYYKIEFNTLGPDKINCKRKLIIRKGLYGKSKYENYRKFRETIAKTDNSKIVIAKT